MVVSSQDDKTGYSRNLTPLPSINTALPASTARPTGIGMMSAKTTPGPRAAASIQTCAVSKSS